MILTDTGPLLALIDTGERGHGECVSVLQTLVGPMVTTWPAFTEAIYLAGERGGWRFQQMLWGLLRRDRLVLRDLHREEVARSAELMEKYRDLPMDLADDTLVALAETLGQRRVFTIDRHFSVYRLRDRTALETVPGPAEPR